MSDNHLPYSIEAMAQDDIGEVMVIERQSFPLPWSWNAYLHELRDNHHSYYIVVRLKSPPAPPVSFWMRLIGRPQPRPAPVLGYGGFWLIVDEAHISTIAVAQEWRGRGLGELLLLSMIKQGLGLGARVVTLEVRLSNELAQKLYAKYGFKIVGERKHYYRDNGENAYLMTVENAGSPQYAQQLQTLQAALVERLRTQAAERSDRDVR
ncbi:MAG: ribosomal protein S18-alanine N-acetyltransferase [Thermoflexales bacterium]|nr:ribosomal protein S18-alanine N-acetyltransferase [Thermoflexales bacterium]